jgi:transcription antitermination factor NusG
MEPQTILDRTESVGVAKPPTMEINQSTLQWFALRVKSRHEKTVALAARNKGFEEFLPLYRWRQTWSDRSKWVEMPLFPGYVFCRLDSARRLPLLTIPGVLNFVSFGKTPVAIDDAEIASVQAAVLSDLVTEPCSFVDKGQRVRIQRGPLAGTEGILIDAAKRQQVVVSLTILRRSIAVNIDSQWVEPLALQMSAGDRRE